MGEGSQRQGHKGFRWHAADDWTLLGATGAETKAQHLSDLKSGGGGLEFQTLSEVKVRVFGDTAVVTGSAEQKSSNMANNTSVTMSGPMSS
jgi:hypothetical protein